MGDQAKGSQLVVCEKDSTRLQRPCTRINAGRSRGRFFAAKGILRVGEDNVIWRHPYMYLLAPLKIRRLRFRFHCLLVRMMPVVLPDAVDG